jgi:chemotaxis signal transduction protein
VDGVSEVIRIRSSEIQPPPPMVSGNLDQEFITGVFTGPSFFIGTASYSLLKNRSCI